MSSLSAIGIEDGVFMGGSPGFEGTIKRRPCDFVVNEIDVSGRLVEASSLKLPTLPTTPPSPPLATPSAAPTTSATSETSTQPSPSTSTSTSAIVPSPPCPGAVSPAAAAAAAATADEVKRVEVAGRRGGGEDEEDESNAGWLQQLRRCLGGSESELARLAKLDAAARGPSTTAAAPVRAGDEGGSARLDEVGANYAAKRREAAAPAADAACSGAKEGSGDNSAVGGVVEAEEGEMGKAVRIPAGHGADKAARARVHRAVQETFPFVKTATERGPDDAVTVVCTQAAPLAALRELLSGPGLEALQRMVNRGPAGLGAEAGVSLPCDQDRAKRTLVHRAIAEAFPYLQTKTHADRKEPKLQRVSVFWCKRRGGGGGGGKKRKREGLKGGDVSGSRDRGSGGMEGFRDRWVRFGLRKEGCEHHRTALALSKGLRVPLSALSFSGIKDKTAITTQACVVRGVPPRKILEINGSIPGVTVGNLSYCDHGLSLGELSGNNFSIVVRGAKVPGRAVESSLQAACLGGFVNFFGTQRVGSPSAAARGQPLPYQIGRDILSGDWGGAVTKILAARVNDPPFLRSALQDFLGGKITPKECAARVRGSNRLSMERSVLQGLVRYGPSAFQAAIQCVPFGMRTMWVHAYQSHVWNSLACARIRLLGPEAVPGDLILLPDEKPPPDAGAGGANASSGGTGDIGEPPPPTPVIADKMSCATRGGMLGRDGTGMTGGAGAGGGWMTSSGSSSTVVVNGRRRETVGVLTSEMMQTFASEGITPRDLLLRRVVLPLAGTSILYPLHGVGDMYRQRLMSDGVHPSMLPGLRPDHGEAAAAAALTASTTPGDDPARTCPPLEERTAPSPGGDPVQPATTVAAESRGLSNGAHSESRTQRRGGGGDSEKGNATAASTSTAAPLLASSSGLVPRGAYRRLVCIPADASWESATPWADDDAGGAGENPGAPGSSASSRADEKKDRLADSGGAPAPVAGSAGSRTAGDSGARGVGAAEGGTTAVARTMRSELSALPEDVRLTFTLPPGSFATMFLRELMKRNDDIVWEGPRGKEDGEGGGGTVELNGK